MELYSYENYKNTKYQHKTLIKTINISLLSDYSDNAGRILSKLKSYIIDVFTKSKNGPRF